MKVLFGRERFGGELDWTELAPFLPDWEILGCPRGEVAERLDGVDVLCPFGVPVDEALIERGRFGLVQVYGVGVDGVDVPAATRAGVWVCRLPGELTGNAVAVAELAVLQILAAVRRLDEARSALAGGRWGQPVGRSLVGATAVIVGLGAIGTEVAARLRGFGTRMVGVRANPSRGGPDGVERVVGPEQLLEVLGQADVVVCAAMGGPSTWELFDERAFRACRPGAVFVNVARGAMVDDTALLAALDSGRIGAAGLDVYRAEPTDPAGALVNHPNVLATPHVGGLTEQMFSRAGELFAANLRGWAAGQPPRWAVNRPDQPR